ncbi:MAG: hypothetical protein ACPGWR_18020 [Ardenticatenaceae bacterium]
MTHPVAKYIRELADSQTSTPFDKRFLYLDKLGNRLSPFDPQTQRGAPQPQEPRQGTATTPPFEQAKPQAKRALVAWNRASFQIAPNFDFDAVRRARNELHREIEQLRGEGDE